MKQSDTQREFLEKSTTLYHASLPGSPAEKHLVNRGLLTETSREQLNRFRLGFVEDPEPGHEQYRGMLSIPYLRWAPGKGWSVASIRFRCIQEHKHGDGCHKYNTVAGDRSRIFNTVSLLQETEDVGIAEGEFDAITATLCGIETAGVGGAKAWKKHFRKPFLGYRNVFVFTDGDQAGREFGGRVAEELPNARIIPMPEGQDVGSIVAAHGKQELLRRVYR